MTATTLLGLAIALCFAIWEYTIEYTQGGITGSTIEMIMTLSYISVPFLSWHLPYVFRLRYGGFARRIFSIQHFVWDIFENGAARQRQEESWKMKRCHFAQKHARDRIRQYRVLRYILTVGTLALYHHGNEWNEYSIPTLVYSSSHLCFSY